MGTWDIGPFDNDTAADFAGDLDEAALEEREPMIRRVLKRAADVTDFLETPDAERAVAAAALVVAQHPDGWPACSNYGPSAPLPELSADLRTLAVEALDQVVAESSEIAELWHSVAEGRKWRQDITRLRYVLDPPGPAAGGGSLRGLTGGAQAPAMHVEQLSTRALARPYEGCTLSNPLGMVIPPGYAPCHGRTRVGD